MTSLLQRSRLLLPTITRESISWRTVSPGIVEIAIDLENPGSEPTSPGDLVVETAALGAFVPFRPVTRIALGSLEPGGRRRITKRVDRSELPPPPVMPPGFGAMLAQVARQGGIDLKPEVLDLVARSQWAGNLNVYFDAQPDRAVEVHRAFDLRVRTGQPVALMVMLPADRSEFEFHLRASDPEWKVQVVDLFGMDTVIIQPAPTIGSRAEVTIEVIRKADGRAVPVDLSLETVAGDGTTLGCVGV